jgi:hypothetical protein
MTIGPSSGRCPLPGDNLAGNLLNRPSDLNLKEGPADVNGGLPYLMSESAYIDGFERLK